MENNLTIFNVYVAMDSQETCDRMKAVCLENGLPIWKDEIAFMFFNESDNFTYSNTEGFFISCHYDKSKTQVTEAEFLELLKEYKSQNK
jgi:hypothetical protein